jgi:hypothetical protein
MVTLIYQMKTNKTDHHYNIICNKFNRTMLKDIYLFFLIIFFLIMFFLIIFIFTSED